MSDNAGRPLSDGERAVLAAILSAEVPGAAQLRAQLATTTARGPFIVAQGSLELAVSGQVPRDPSGNTLFPVRTSVEPGGQFVGELLLWLEGGVLHSVEYATVTDEAPTGLPDPALLLVEPEQS